MSKFMKKIKIICLLLLFVFCGPNSLIADGFEFSRIEMSFKNFIRCELTRTGATNHFKGKSFKITMIDLFDIQNESDLKIISGAVKCFVDDKYVTLYAVVGLKTIMGTEQIVYYTIRNKDFSILATELFKHPYKERCKWSQYWIDIN